MKNILIVILLIIGSLTTQAKTENKEVKFKVVCGMYIPYRSGNPLDEINPRIEKLGKILEVSAPTLTGETVCATIKYQEN